MAEAELQDAATWYDERSPGLGLRFVLAVRKKSDEILESPQRWPLAAGSDSRMDLRSLDEPRWAHLRAGENLGLSVLFA